MTARVWYEFPRQGPRCVPVRPDGRPEPVQPGSSEQEGLWVDPLSRDPAQVCALLRKRASASSSRHLSLPTKVPSWSSSTVRLTARRAYVGHRFVEGMQRYDPSTIHTALRDV
jgi:hypothetical protein